MPGDGDRKRSILGTRVEVWAVKRLARRAALVIQDRFHGPIPARAGQPGGRWQAGWPTRAYPRSRGATDKFNDWASRRLGLSPLARGNPIHMCPIAPCRGPIPARAGQPTCARGRRPPAGAYPRSRGATGTTTARVVGYEGLSPLARGNRTPTRRGPGPTGPIPARAGQPPAPCALAILARAYPRSRGATSGLSCSGVVSGGLSPLARGNLTVQRHVMLVRGPIPARAGQPLSAWKKVGGVRAYPRSRGATCRCRGSCADF